MEDKIINDTQTAFMAYAFYVLHERNKFGQGRCLQFMQDVQQIASEMDYDEVRLAVKEKIGAEFPEIKE